MSQEVTKSEEFKPTPAMVVWLDVAVKNTTDKVSQIARESNISRQSWYRWVQNDDFIGWFKAEWEKRLRLFAWKLDMIGLQKASEDFRYWLAMQKRVGNITDAKESWNNNQISNVVYLPHRQSVEKPRD